MSKKIFKVAGIWAMCLAGALGLTACGGKGGNAKIISIDILEETIPAQIASGEFDNQNIVLKVCYDDGSEELVTIKTSDIPSEYRDGLILPGTHTIKVSYGGFEDEMTLTISLSSEKVAIMLANVYNYHQTHDHKEKCEYIARCVSVTGESEPSEEKQEYGILYNYNPNTQKAEALATFLNGSKRYTSQDKIIESDMIMKCDNEKINSFRQWDPDTQNVFGYSSQLYDYRCAPATLLATGSGYSVSYDAELINGSMIYTAEFKNDGMKIIYKFDSEKVIELVIEQSYADETNQYTYINKYNLEYREVDDSETSESLVDVSVLNNGVANVKSLLQGLKEQEFTLTKNVGTYQVGERGTTTSTTTYTHTSESETLTYGDDVVNLFDIVPLFESYLDGEYEVNTTPGGDDLSVILDSLLSIKYSVKNDKITSIEVSDINSNLYYEISINY